MAATMRAPLPSATTTTASGSTAGSSGTCRRSASTSSRAGRGPGSCGSTASARCPGDRIEAGQEIRVPPLESDAGRGRRGRSRKREPLTDGRRAVRPRHGDLRGSAARSCSTSRRGSRRRAAPRPPASRPAARRACGEGERPKLVHRLDKDTSGALLVARTRARGRAFRQGLFRAAPRARSIGRWSSACPTPTEGMIDAPLAKQPGTGGEKMHVDEEHGLPAKTRWRVIDRAGNRAAWVELQPLTGRTHQLRAHMAAIGHPIVGDAKYGGADAFLTGGISRKLHLHARRIRIDAPDGGKIDVTAELPEHFAESLATLGFESAGGRYAAARAERRAVARGEAAKVAAAAKARRRERRGERRARGSQAEGEAAVNRLAIFDCDGTLVDSGATDPCARSRRAFAAAWSRAAAARSHPRKVIGLSLTEAMAALLPDAEPEQHVALGRGLQARILALRAGGRGRGAAVRRRARAARRARGGRLAARGRDRQVGPRPHALPREPRHPRALRLAADRRPAPVEAAPVDGRAGDRRRRRRAGDDDRHRRHQLRHGDGGERRARRDRRRLGLSRRRGAARGRRGRGRRAAARRARR